MQLLQGVFRVYHCNWLMPSQKASVESCIRVLSDVGKTPTQVGFNMMKMRCPVVIKATLDGAVAVKLCEASAPGRLQSQNWNGDLLDS